MRHLNTQPHLRKQTTMFVVAIILVVIAAALFVGAHLAARKPQTSEKKSSYGSSSTIQKSTAAVTKLWLRLSGGALAAVAALFLLLTSFYGQDVGQANVLRDWTGKLVGYETEAGLHLKAPWVDTVTFDVRNQRVVYVNPDGQNSDGDNSGGTSDGPQITVQDADGVTDQVDIAIRYSLKPDSVLDIYSEYLNEDNLKARLITNDIRSVVRSAAGNYSTLDLLTKRDDVAADIRDRLSAKWADAGLIVEDVALQEIVAPESVRNSYSAAQEAEINVSTEQSKLEAEKVKAQQKVVNAQAESDANAILNASLSDQILQQRYLDTLKELAASGNVVVVPEGFNGLVNVGK